VTSIGSGTK